MKKNWYAMGGLAALLVALVAAGGMGDGDAGMDMRSANGAQDATAGPVPTPMPQRSGLSTAPGQSTGTGQPLPAIAMLPAHASLPDRGDLVAYPASPVVRREGAYTWHRADFSLEHALGAIASGELAMTSPSGEQLRFRYDRHVEHENGDLTWIGHAVGGSPADDAIVTFGAHAVLGTVAQLGRAALRVEMRDGASWIVETDRIALAAKSKAEGRYATPDFFVPPQLPPADADATGHATAAAARVAGAAAAADTIDVLIGYTPGFVAGNMGGPGGNISFADTKLNSMVAITNESYANSNVPMRVRLVHKMQVDYPDATANSNALYDLTGSNSDGAVAIPAALQALRAAREQFGADLVSLVRDFNHPENDSCGVAWLLGSGMQTLSTQWQTHGYSVVSDGFDGGFFCEDTTFAHELGHNMGLAHDVETMKGDDGVLQNNEYGRYSYSFGYKTGPTQGHFYTVMAYNDDQPNGYRVFSNPRITFCGGFQCGKLNEADNALTLQQTMPIIASFRASLGPDPEPEPPTRVDRDTNADGRADLIWFNPVAGMVQAWQMDGASWTYGAVHVLGENHYRIAGVGDFNGDGRADVLWRDGASTGLWAWLAKADGSVEVVYLRGYPAGWRVAGVADFNADGRADVFWYNPEQGLTQAWYMDGSTWAYGPVTGLAPGAYDIAAIGDFSGDGRADIVWHDNAKTTLWMWSGQSGGGFEVTFLRDYPAGWSIEGTGDANDDGRKDIFWHNPTAGLLQAWLMNGTTWTYGPPFGIASRYQVGAIDDFNGDGRSDIMWHDGGDAWVWLASGDSYVVHYLRGYPAGWVVANHP